VEYSAENAEGAIVAEGLMAKPLVNVSCIIFISQSSFCLKEQLNIQSCRKTNARTL